MSERNLQTISGKTSKHRQNSSWNLKLQITVLAYVQKENQNYSLVALANSYFLILQLLNLTNFKKQGYYFKFWRTNFLTCRMITRQALLKISNNNELLVITITIHLHMPTYTLYYLYYHIHFIYQKYFLRFKT